MFLSSSYTTLLQCIHQPLSLSLSLHDAEKHTQPALLRILLIFLSLISLLHPPTGLFSAVYHTGTACASSAATAALYTSPSTWHYDLASLLPLALFLSVSSLSRSSITSPDGAKSAVLPPPRLTTPTTPTTPTPSFPI